MFIVEGDLLRETPAAYLIDFGGDEYWVPKSLIEDENIERTLKRDMISCAVPEWFAIEKGMI